MTREEADALVAEVMAEHFERLRDVLIDTIERNIRDKPIPPFTPPTPWTPARYGAGVTVRHRNGMFYARRDTDEEPGTADAWLPLLVGVAGIDMRWNGERALVLAVELSDGRVVETERELAMPIVRGYWDAETIYAPGDRVFRYGEWHACAPSQGIDPTADGGEQAWVKVAGKAVRTVSFKLDDDGTMYESGHAIGSVKPVIVETLERLVPR
jgi:hypothetical protein